MHQTSVLYDPRTAATPSQREFEDKRRQSQARMAKAAVQFGSKPAPAPSSRPFLPLEFGRKAVEPEPVAKWRSRQRAVPLPAVDRVKILQAVAQIDPRVVVVQEIVAQFYGVTLHDLKGRHRLEGAMMPRHVAVWLAYSLVQKSYPKLALRFGGKDHTSLLNSVRRVDARRAVDYELQNELNGLTAEILARIA